MAKRYVCIALSVFVYVLLMHDVLQVGDCDVRNGADCEPVLLIVSYSPHGDTSQPVVDHRWGYPKDMTLGQLRV